MENKQINEQMINKSLTAKELADMLAQYGDAKVTFDDGENENELLNSVLSIDKTASGEVHLTLTNGQTVDMIPEDEFFEGVAEEEVISSEDLFEADEKVNEDEWLSADDLAEDEVTEAQYADNTVGAFIDLLRRKCKMEDVLLPRLNPKKKEMMVFAVYSKAGRAVIDFIPGRIDDPAAI